VPSRENEEDLIQPPLDNPDRGKIASCSTRSPNVPVTQRIIPGSKTVDLLRIRRPVSIDPCISKCLRKALEKGLILLPAKLCRVRVGVDDVLVDFGIGFEEPYVLNNVNGETCFGGYTFVELTVRS